MVSEGADNYAIEQSRLAKIFFYACSCRYVRTPFHIVSSFRSFSHQSQNSTSRFDESITRNSPLVDSPILLAAKLSSKEDVIRRE